MRSALRDGSRGAVAQCIADWVLTGGGEQIAIEAVKCVGAEGEPCFREFAFRGVIPHGFEENEELVGVTLVEFGVDRVMNQLVAWNPSSFRNRGSNAGAEFGEGIFDNANAADADFEGFQHAGRQEHAIEGVDRGRGPRAGEVIRAASEAIKKGLECFGVRVAQAKTSVLLDDIAQDVHARGVVRRPRDQTRHWAGKEGDREVKMLLRSPEVIEAHAAIAKSFKIRITPQAASGENGVRAFPDSCTGRCWGGGVGAHGDWLFRSPRY